MFTIKYTHIGDKCQHVIYNYPQDVFMVGNPNEILDRIKEQEGFKGHGSEANLARFLGIKPQNLDQWRRRKTFDFETILNKCEKYDLNWLFTGKAFETETDSKKEIESLNASLGYTRGELDKCRAKIEVLKELINEKKK
jgi:hypothetical protein